MENSLPFVTSLVNAHGLYVYLVLFIVAIVEGPIVMVVSGFLAKLGVLGFLPAYAVLLFGDLLADFGWYGVGYFGAKGFIYRYGHIVSLTRENVEKVEKIFHRHSRKILFLSKITMGFGFALVTLITAGMVRIPFKRYAVLNFFGGIVWTAFLMGLGFLFGNVFILVEKSLKLGFLLVMAAFLIAAFYGFGRFVKTKMFPS